MSHSNQYAFIAARKRDARSPCPALNALANHGYIPRSGRDISFVQLIGAMTKVYNISLPLAIFLSITGYLLCGHGIFHSRLHLSALAAHKSISIEHDASLSHEDTAPGSNFASTTPSLSLVRSVISYAAPDRGLTFLDFARARVEREWGIGKPLGEIHAKIGRGEVVLTWLLLRDGDGEVPVEMLEDWWGEERLPEGWARPKARIGLGDAKRAAAVMSHFMNGFKG